MCTLTIIPIDAPSGFRLVTNRDEQRDRPNATPPRRHEICGRQWIWPEDGLAGGAWVGASESGLALSILNLNLTPGAALPPRDRLTSRGHLIPSLARCAGADEALEALSAMALDNFAPFRLVAADFARVGVARWDRERLTIDRLPMAPVCLVSSGLGDAKVAPRLALFDEFISTYGPTRRMQDAYHRHFWPARADISVMMSRRDARTVSTTAVEVVRAEGGVTVDMRYTADHESVLCRIPASARPVVEIAPRKTAAAGPVR